MLKKELAVVIILIFILSSLIPIASSYSSYETNKVYSIHIDENGTLSGYVTDPSMNPIKGVRVRVYFHETYEENYTDASGYYNVTNIPICYCLKNATASKNGYATEWVLLSIVENTTHDFILTFLSEELEAHTNGPYEGVVDEPIEFIGFATGGEPPYNWYWSFGDGNISIDPSTTYAYSSPGEYSVFLKVVDDEGNIDINYTTATIYPDDTLIVDAGGPYSGVIGETIQFSGSAIGGTEPYSWYWEFGDGNISTIQNPTHTYTTVDEYTATLTVTDTYGEIDDDTAMVTINSHPPNKPEITGPNSGKAGEEYDYTFSSVDPDGDAVQFYIEWGDGNSEWTGFNSSGDSFTRSHIWDEKDTYIIRAKAKDSNGAESDWATLEVSMPKNKASNPFILFLERLIERFPILEQILQPIYDKLA